MIEQATIDAIVSKLDAALLDEEIVLALRAQFPDLHFTYCMDDDIGTEEPVLEKAAYNLYLVNGEGHCLKLTTDAAVANGVVIAEIIDD